MSLLFVKDIDALHYNKVRGSRIDRRAAVTEISKTRASLCGEIVKIITVLCYSCINGGGPAAVKILTLIATGMPLGFIIAFCTYPPLPLPKISANY